MMDFTHILLEKTKESMKLKTRSHWFTAQTYLSVIKIVMRKMEQIEVIYKTYIMVTATDVKAKKLTNPSLTLVRIS